MNNGNHQQGKQHSSYHIPVLLNEVLHYLAVKPAGVYVDCTFGGGGHAKAILQQLDERGRLVAFDQDADARRNLPADSRLLFIPQNFRHLKRFLRLHGLEQVDGILADLGVSSHQFDEATRGFSTRFDAPLDMRMDQRQERTAAHIVNEYSGERLHRMFEQLGEVSNSKTLARTIVEARRVQPLQTVRAFRDAVAGIVRGNPNRYFAQVFQAIRMEVNDETAVLRELLEQSADMLKPGGRLVIITFHSIEDRIVKQFFRENTFDPAPENPFETEQRPRVLKPVNKKPVTASAAEIKNNPRSRSAKLRAAEKINHGNAA